MYHCFNMLSFICHHPHSDIHLFLFFSALFFSLLFQYIFFVFIWVILYFIAAFHRIQYICKTLYSCHAFEIDFWFQSFDADTGFSFLFSLVFFFVGFIVSHILDFMTCNSKNDEDFSSIIYSTYSIPIYHWKLILW